MPPKGSRRKAAGGTATPSLPLPGGGTNTTGTTTPLPATPTPGVPGAQTPQPTVSLAESLSFLHEPRPFKNPYYAKNQNRRAKTLKQVLNAERERVRVERERLRSVLDAEAEAEADAAAKEANGENGEEERMEVDKNLPTMSEEERRLVEEDTSYTSTEAAPSTRPHPHYCDITGLEGPYTEPKTMLRYHDKDVYEVIKGLNVAAARDYLALRGVVPIVK